MCTCSHTTHYFSQPPLAALPIIPLHAGVITVTLMCDFCRYWLNLWPHFSISETFHPSVHCVTKEESHARTGVKLCCFDIKAEKWKYWKTGKWWKSCDSWVVWKFSSFIWQIHVTGTCHSWYMPDNGQFAVSLVFAVLVVGARTWS
jgi:hypothetical protein